MLAELQPNLMVGKEKTRYDTLKEYLKSFSDINARPKHQGGIPYEINPDLHADDFIKYYISDKANELLSAYMIESNPKKADKLFEKLEQQFKLDIEKLKNG